MYLFCEKVTDSEARVVTIVYEDSVLNEEEKARGIEVEFIPEPEQIAGKTPSLYVNLETQELFYKYVDVQVPDEVTALQQEVNMLTEFIADFIGGAI